MGKYQYSETRVVDGLNAKLTYTVNKIARTLKDLGLKNGDNGFDYLLGEGIAMRECGLTWREVNKALEDKLDLLGSGAY